MKLENEWPKLKQHLCRVERESVFSTVQSGGDNNSPSDDNLLLIQGIGP